MESDGSSNGLRRGILSPLETLAQSIAGIAPSATPGMLIPIVFGFAGNGTWLAYVLATVGIVFTALCINQFTSRRACAGSLYTFVSEGYGHRAGVITGWALLFAYIFCVSASLTEFGAYASSLGKHIFNLEIPVWLAISGGFALAASIAYKNIKMSARLMLWLEFLSMGLILIIVGVVLSRNGLNLDTKQLSLEGVSLENVRMGLVMAIFSFVAFESSASLGVEADKPTISVPRAIMRSVIFSGVFFVVAAYAMVLSFRGAHANLGEATTPLLVITSTLGFADLGQLVNCCIMVSFFAAGLANLNAGARALYQMSRDGLLPEWTGRTHHINQTPHTAIIFASFLGLMIAVSLVAFGAPILDIVGWLGTLATFGFIYGYMATSVAAAKLLRTTGELTLFKISIVSASMAVLILALVGSLFPVPKFPYSILPIIFGVYMVCGACWCFGRVSGEKRSELVVPSIIKTSEQSNG